MVVKLTSEMKRVYIFLNPVAGPDNSGNVRQRIIEHFEAHDWRYEFYTTTGEEQLTEVVKHTLEEESLDLCVAAGGDGTVAGVAGGLVNSQIPLGILLSDPVPGSPKALRTNHPVPETGMGASPGYFCRNANKQMASANDPRLRSDRGLNSFIRSLAATLPVLDKDFGFSSDLPG